MRLTLALLGAFTAGTGGLSWLLHQTLGAPDYLIGVVAAGAMAGFIPVHESLHHRQTTTEQRVANLLARFSLQPPLVVAVYVFLALEFCERLTGGLLGLAIGIAVAGSTATRATLAAVPLLVVGVLAFAVVPIAVYATHRIHRVPLAWVLGAVLFQQIIDIAVEASAFGIPLPLAVASQAIVPVLLLPGILAGYWWGRRTQLSFWMSQLFTQLSSTDQRDLIALVETLPGVRLSRNAASS